MIDTFVNDVEVGGQKQNLTGPVVPPGGTDANAGLLSRTSNFLQDADPTKNAGLQKDLAGFAEERAAGNSFVNQEREGRELKYQAEMERSYGLERAMADDPALKPWQADQEHAARVRGPLEQFGSIGMIFAMAASAFTRAPMTSALNAGAAAMTAMRTSDEEGYKNAFQAWKDNSQLAIKRFDMERTRFEDVNKLSTSNMNLWRLQRANVASEFDDQKTLALLNAGMDPEVLKLDAERVSTFSKFQDSVDKNITMNREQELYSEYIKAHKAEFDKGGLDKLRVVQGALQTVTDSRRPQSRANLTGPQAFTQRWWEEHPNGTVEEFGEAFSKFTREQKPLGGSGHETKSQDQVERIKERTEKYKSQGMLQEEAHSKAATEVEEEDSKARQSGKNRMDQSLVNMLEKYPGMERKDLGDILPTRQPKVIAAVIESPENLEAIAKFTKENPASLGLIAEASKRVNLDAYQALFKSNPEAAKAKISADRDAAIDKLAQERKLDLTQAAQAKVLQKMLTTQAFTDAALAGSRGATIYLDKAFKEIYDPNASPGAFFSILEKRYEEADRVAREYKLGFNDRSPEALKEMPFWTGKAAGYAGKLVTKPPAAGAVQSPDGKWYVESSPNAPGARKNKNGHWYTEVQ